MYSLMLGSYKHKVYFFWLAEEDTTAVLSGNVKRTLGSRRLTVRLIQVTR